MKLTASYFKAGRTTVGTSVVAAASGLPDTLKHGVLLLAHPDNADIIDIGGPDVVSGGGFPLEAGRSVVIPLEYITSVYAIAGASSQVLVWMVV